MMIQVPIPINIEPLNHKFILREIFVPSCLGAPYVRVLAKLVFLFYYNPRKGAESTSWCKRGIFKRNMDS